MPHHSTGSSHSPLSLWKGLALLALLFAASLMITQIGAGPVTPWHFQKAETSAQPVTVQTFIRQAERISIAFTLTSDGFAAKKSSLEAKQSFVLQTSTGPFAIQLIVQHPNMLVLLHGDTASTVLSRRFAYGTPHRVVLTAESGKFFEASVDGKVVYRTTRGDLTHLGSYQLDHFSIGADHTNKYPLIGAIRGIEVTADYTPAPAAPYGALQLGLAVALALAAVWVCYRMMGGSLTAQPYHSIRRILLGGDLLWVGIGSALLAVSIWLSEREWLLGKWTIAVAFAAMLVLAPLTALLWPQANPRIAPYRNGVALGLIASSTAALLCLGLEKLVAYPAEVAIAVIPLLVALSVYQPWQQGREGVRGWLRLSGFLLLLLLSAAAFVTLQNWNQLAKMLAYMPAPSMVLLAIGAVVVTAGCWRLVRADAAASSGWWTWLPYLAFFVFAIRADTLFIDGSVGHWEYFVGPIRTLREGGWLLWNVPSQYGFLNILMAAALPVHSAWDAFYLFQAGCLLIAAGLFYRTMHRYLGAHWLLAAAIAGLTFFLAYPPLIGPAPFPSSSAVRFLGCYVMLYWVARNFLNGAPSFARYLRGGSVLWVLGVLWSAEGAVYVTGIFMAPLALELLIALPRPGLARRAWQLFGLPLGLLGGVVLAMAAYYYVRLGVLPDIGLFFLYSTAYSSGFGEMPIVAGGAVWVYGLLLAFGAAALVTALRHYRTAEGPAGALIAAMGCVLVISTYYIGRAVTNNVIAEYPILCFAALVMLRAGAMAAGPRLGQVAICLPLLLLGLLAPLWNVTLPVVLSSLNVLPVTLVGRVDAPDSELAELMAKARITPGDRTVYYGFIATMPHGVVDGKATSFERTWLANPPQIIEEPITPEARELIVTRYMASEAKDGYFIQKKFENDDRVPAWLALIERSHIRGKQWESAHYRIIHYTAKRETVR